ncbi:uncharacterized protein ASPGLDRAFT_170633 [Aspergillus glaucus CBS 516.65]|uniref:Uncharacterized protein n=1 Tax=Aspergillus glaucus CBS 516.65 TaxID=1160497 RepID=A0A1L9VLC0_ASPGL|nr:hypothetical protein ASPGLDRAFT_170633 [Aspergillus glaucus CBS 516.65]OJJ84728.1 hypothetical protein ASPGLDRAFT_170633 [Aspergillus glaucus CBS 516.65]
MVALYLLFFIISAAFLYNQAAKNIPSRRNAAQAPRSKFGIVKVKKDNLGLRSRAGGVDVIFVHGLGSNPDTTWRAEKAQEESHSRLNKEYVCWITDFLPEDIPSPQREDVRLFFYNYDSFWQRDAVQTRLYRLGAEMLERIRHIREKEEEHDRDLIFVGHSYGGLVIKEALIQANANKESTDIIEHVKAVLFLGTPHRGSNFSSWGKVIASLLQPLSSNPSILGELTYDSLSLHDLHDRFMKVATKIQYIANFFEQRKTRILKVWWFHWEEFCVREQSATFSIPNQLTQVKNIGLTVDHYGLNKFQSREGNFEMIFEELWGAIKPVLAQRQRSLYSVPIQPVRSFTERAALSKEIEEKLQQDSLDRPRPHAAAICGPGGTGKTQLALKYIEDNKNKFNPILWVDAEDEETARTSFEQCATVLQIPVDRTLGQGSHPRDSPTVQAVRRWLQHCKESNEEWLVVFDNVDNMTWGVFDILPRGQRGNIIITSQDEQSWKLLDGCEKVSVEIMNPLEARGLLFWHLNLGHQPVDQDTKDLCDQVAERLENLPLAVDLAGAYIANALDSQPNPQSALTQYLDYYAKHQNRLLRNSRYNGLSSYGKTVWTVWDTTLQKIEERYSGRHSKLLLIFLGHFSSGFVQEELFRLASLGFASVQHDIFAGHEDFPDWLKEFLTIDGDRWDDFYYGEALEPLINYGLLRSVKEEWSGVRMHSLVRWRAMQYKYDYQEPWNRWHMEFMLGACHELLKDTAKPQFRRHIVIHIPQTSPSSIKSINEEGRAKMWDILGKTYNGEGRYEEAEVMHQRALGGREKALGPEHPSTLVSAINLGRVLERQGRYEAAEAVRWHHLTDQQQV